MNNPVKIIISVLLLMFFLLLQVIVGRFFAGETAVVCLFLIITVLPKNFFFSISNLFVPQNVAFVIFFLRLYIIPLTGVIWGYHHEVPLPPYSKAHVFLSYLLELLAYFVFLAGWEIQYSFIKNGPGRAYKLNRSDLKKLALLFAAIGIIPLLLFYDSITDYLMQVFVFNNLQTEPDGNGKLGGLIQVFSRYFLPFTVFCLSSLLDFKKGGKFRANLILGGLVIMTLLLSLNTNRQSMIYPILGLIGGLSGKILKFKILPILLAASMGMYALFMFKELRSIDALNPELEVIGIQDIATTLQVYGTGPLTVAPSLDMEIQRNTILPSFFSSVPLLGKPLRERSGVAVYNKAVYEFRGVAEDQVFPTVGEAYANGGILLVFVFFLTVGYIYASLNRYFINTTESDVLYRSSVFYLALLFNATILLSFQVMGQFLFYNSIPALMVLAIYHLRNKGKSGKLSVQKEHLTHSMIDNPENQAL